MSHEAIVSELACDDDPLLVLRRMASIPARKPTWWERVLGAELLVFWALFGLMYAVDLATSLAEMTFAGLGGSLIGILFAVQVWLRNGAAYGAGALWILFAAAYDWWLWMDAPDDSWDVSLAAMGWWTAVLVGTALIMVLLQRRLFPHVTFIGQHRASPERRIIQF